MQNSFSFLYRIKSATVIPIVHISSVILALIVFPTSIELTCADFTNPLISVFAKLAHCIIQNVSVQGV